MITSRSILKAELNMAMHIYIFVYIYLLYIKSLLYQTNREAMVTRPENSNMGRFSEESLLEQIHIATVNVYVRRQPDTTRNRSEQLCKY